MEFLVLFVSHKKYRCDGSIVIFDGCWLKLFSHKLARVLRSSIRKGGNIFVARGSAACACTSSFLPPSQELIHELFLIGIHASIYEPDANDGFRLALP